MSVSVRAQISYSLSSPWSFVPAENFQTEHDAGFAQADFCNQLLKALPIDRRCTRLPRSLSMTMMRSTGHPRATALWRSPYCRLECFRYFRTLGESWIGGRKIVVSLQVPGVHFLVCDARHGVASCCRERIIPASSVVSCVRISTGRVCWPSDSEYGSVWTASYSEQACIQAVMPRRRKSARSKPPPPVRRAASRRGCS